LFQSMLMFFFVINAICFTRKIQRNVTVIHWRWGSRWKCWGRGGKSARIGASWSMVPKQEKTQVCRSVKWWRMPAKFSSRLCSSRGLWSSAIGPECSEGVHVVHREGGDADVIDMDVGDDIL